MKDFKINESCVKYLATPNQIYLYNQCIRNNSYNKKCILSKAIKFKENINVEKLKQGIFGIFKFNDIFKYKFKILKDKNLEEKLYGIQDNNYDLKIEKCNERNYDLLFRPFNLSECPLIRLGIFNRDTLIINAHRIISDEVSLNNLSNDLLKYYYENDNLNDFGRQVPFTEYANNYEKRKNTKEYLEKIKFLKKTFNSNYNILNMPKKDSLQDNKVYEKLIERETASLEGNDYKNLIGYINQSGNDLNTFLFCIFGVVMSKYSGKDIIYTSFINKNRCYDNKEMIGPYSTMEPFLMKIDENDTLTNLILKTFKELTDYKKTSIHFSEIENYIKLLKVDNVFMYENGDLLDNNLISENEGNYKENEFYESECELYNNLNFAFKIIERENQVKVIIEYNKTIYEKYLMKNILESFIEVIRKTENYNKNISDIEYMTITEKEKVIYKFNSNSYNTTTTGTYHEEFEKVCRQYSHKNAVVFERKPITYEKLNNMSNSLGHLLRKNKIGRGDVVPIVSERSYYYVVAAIAVMKAGGAFLPIDPEFPEDRIKFMINEVKARLILKYIPSYNGKRIIEEGSIYEYDIGKHNYNENIDKIENINAIDDISYIMFTSGTTGRPKGVLMRHSNLTNYCLYSLTYNGVIDYFKDYKNVLSIAKFTYTLSISDIFYPLVTGRTIILCNDNESTNPDLLGKLILNYHVDFMSGTPSRITNYLNTEIFQKSVSHIKAFGLGGELVTSEFLSLMNKYTNAIIYCCYGLTETIAINTLIKVEKDSIIQSKMVIGKPTCNTGIFILDKNLKPVPVGVEGEIYISGHNVGKGYLNQEKLTKERFITCPFYVNNYQGKMYKTGDLGKWTKDGYIIHLGRMDFQIKIRGQRIEIKEIESVINEIESIQYNLVLARVNQEGEKYLVSYYICDHNESKKINGHQIRNILQGKLPLYMIPNYFIEIEKIPLNSNGKLDRKALPEPEMRDLISKNYVEPVTDTEKALCSIYSEVFNIMEGNIGKMTDIYELGGNSLNAIKISSKIQSKFRVKMNIKTILERPLIYELAKYIDENINNTDMKYEEDHRIIKRDSKEFPITSQQLGIYVESLKNPNSISYNNPRMYKLGRNVNIEKLKNEFEKIFKEEEILRSKYIEKEINNETKIYGVIDEDCSLIFESYNHDNMNSFLRPFD